MNVQFEFPAALWCAIPLAGGVALGAWRQLRRGQSRARVAALAGLRCAALLPLVLLAGRPVWVAHEPPASASRPVAVLLDRSESMSLEEQDVSRYQRAVIFLRDRLLPALKSARLPIQAIAFDEQAEGVDGTTLASVVPKGKRTNLGAGIAQALSGSGRPPLAVIALTDGIANENAENTRAASQLIDARVPFIGVGFGSDQGVPTLTLREVDAPPNVAPRTGFSVSAQIELMNLEEVPAFDLLLYRDGQIVQKKSVQPAKGSRSRLENFQLTENQDGIHTFMVQVLPPSLSALKCVNLSASTSVRISEEKELRVLYIQGALTWDYKFINLALRTDHTIKLTGLTRTSKQSVFRQNVENAGELINGFPASLEELAPFRVVILSNLRAADLTPAQQELLARFCGELGGGLLMIGGSSTFDSSWQRSRLEQLMPVVFSSNPGVLGLDRSFRLQPSEEAFQHPVFQIADTHSLREAWAQLPPFSQYGRVDAPKPGAQVWMYHPTDIGPQGKRVLMASQRYGAGLSAVLTIQNFWRWRLSRDADPRQFDRFWRQLFRFLSEIGRQDIAIHLADQELHPQMDVQVILEKQPSPGNITDSNRKFFVRVEDGAKKLLSEQAVELEPLRPVDFKFHADKPGVYTIVVTDGFKTPLSTRPVEIRDVNVEFQNTARNMETLRQWASISDGLAFKVEECPAAEDLVAQIKDKVEEVRRGQQTRRIIGVNGWVLALVLGCLSCEWILRKRWNLV